MGLKVGHFNISFPAAYTSSIAQGSHVFLLSMRLFGRRWSSCFAQRYSATNTLIPVFLSSSHRLYHPTSSPISEFCLCTFASDLSSLTPPSTSLVLIRPKHCRHAHMQGRQPDLQFIGILSANGCIVHLVLRVKPHRLFGCRYVMKILILVCPEWLRG